MYQSNCNEWIPCENCCSSNISANETGRWLQWLQNRGRGTALIFSLHADWRARQKKKKKQRWASAFGITPPPPSQIVHESQMLPQCRMKRSRVSSPLLPCRRSVWLGQSTATITEPFERCLDFMVEFFILLFFLSSSLKALLIPILSRACGFY